MSEAPPRRLRGDKGTATCCNASNHRPGFVATSGQDGCVCWSTMEVGKEPISSTCFNTGCRTMSRGDENLVTFKGSDFSFWKCQIVDYLYSKELDLPLEGKPDDMGEAKWKTLDRKVLGTIRLTLTNNVQKSVAKATTTTELMTILSNMYEKPSVNNKVFLATRFFNLKMAEDTSVNAHINEFEWLMKELAAVELKFTDEVNAILLLRSLPDSWEIMKIALLNSCGKEKLQFSLVKDFVIAKEICRQDSSVASTSTTALNVDRGRSNNKSHENQGKTKNNKSKCNDRLECWNCGKTGHLKRNCKALKWGKGR